ncbi:hypothetical protein Fmac_031306 [Flemingia macrophylla]|uniref:Exocyst subunit Exo70 family protein n=1 Tax=Flemingia macrophylla TaxID=520843 RepID=A0ABD1L1M7_9FABA
MKVKLWLVIVGGSFSYSLIKLRYTLDVHVPLIRRDLELHVVEEDIESGSLLSARSSASQVIITCTSNSTSQTDVPLQNEDLTFLATQFDSDSRDSDNMEVDSSLSNRKYNSWRIERELAQQREQRLCSFIELISSASSIIGNSRFSSAAIFLPLINSCTVIEKERIGKILIARFVTRIKALKKKNNSVIKMISKHVETCLKANVVDIHTIPVPQRDENLVVDVLRYDDVDNTFCDLRGTARLMVMAGFEEECCAAYCSWRREFLNESLSAFGLMQGQDVEKRDKIQCWIKAFKVAVRILFPNERMLCDWVFGRFISSSDFAFAEVCTELATCLLSTADALANFIPHTLEELIHWLLPVTLELTNFIRFNSAETTSGLKVDSDGMISPSVHMFRLTRLFERSLKANSKNYNNLISVYVFILNNRSYIDIETNIYSMPPIANSWLRKNKRKIEKYLKLYQRSSWTKILNILKLDINESERNAAAKLMKDKLRSFNEHFDDICNDQSTWSVFDQGMRKRMIKSIEEILLPAYGNLVGMLQDFLGNHAYEFIKYGMIDIQGQLNNLFLVRE